MECTHARQSQKMKTVLGAGPPQGQARTHTHGTTRRRHQRSAALTACGPRAAASVGGGWHPAPPPPEGGRTWSHTTEGASGPAPAAQTTPIPAPRCPPVCIRYIHHDATRAPDRGSGSSETARPQGRSVAVVSKRAAQRRSIAGATGALHERQRLAQPPAESHETSAQLARGESGHHLPAGRERVRARPLAGRGANARHPRAAPARADARTVRTLTARPPP